MLKFRSTDAIRAWLRDTDDGKRITEEILVANMGRVPVLVELHPDGWVAVYSTLDATVKVVNRPLVALDESADLANAIDEWIEWKAGERHASIFEPRFQRWAGMIERMTPELMRDWCEQIEYIRGLRDGSTLEKTGGRTA